MNFEEILKSKTKDHRYLKRYIAFMEACSTQSINKSQYSEKHHILPKSLYPEYKKNPKNIVLLTGKQHYIAHWMLAKALDSSEMWFAFNQMRRIAKNGILYEYAREKISTAISKANTGKKRSKEHMKKIIMSTKNKKRAMLKETKTILFVNNDDERWLTGELTSVKTGYKHTQKTKNKIGKANKGKKWFINENQDVKMFRPDEVPIGFVPYDNPNWHNPTCPDTVWYYDPTTGEQVRLNKYEKVKEKLIKGRNPDLCNGFQHINHSESKVYLDLKNKKYSLIDPFEKKSYHVNFTGHSINKIMICIFKDKDVIVGAENILRYLKNKKIFITRNELKEKYIKNPHHNNTAETKIFRNKHKGKNINDIGIYITTLNDFELSENHNIIEDRKWK